MTDIQESTSLLVKIGEFEEQLAAQPDSKVFVPLAEAYRKMDMLDEAIDTIAKGLKFHPELPVALVAQGRIKAQQGRLDEAVDSFQRVIGVDGKHVMALKGLARIRLMQNDMRQAISVVKQLLQIVPDDPDVAKLKRT